MKLKVPVFTSLCVAFVLIGLSHAQTPPLVFSEGNYTRIIEPTIAPVTGAGTFTAIPYDLRGNGKFDILIGMGVFPPAAKTNVPMRVLRPAGDGTLRDITRQLFGSGALPAMVHPREFAVADLNRDGRPDIFVAGHGYDTAPFEGERNVLMMSKADGTYEDRSSLLPTIPDFSHSTTVADINGDGFLDIYVGQVFGGTKVGPYFLMGKADGSYEKRDNNLLPLMRTLGRKFVSSLLLDVNADGFPDLILGTDHDGGNADNIVLLNDGTGDFTKRPEISLPRSVFGTNQNVMDIVPFDVNGDGKLDLLICGTKAVPFYVGRFLQVLISQGDGTFRDETSTRLVGAASSETGGWNMFIRLADINGDGAPDILVRADNGYSGEPLNVIWLNDGAGRFTAVSSTVLANRLGPVEMIDVDEDGRMDLVEFSGDGQGGLQYRPFFNRTPFKSISRRGGIDIDGNNRSVLTIHSASNQLQSGRLVNNVFQWTTMASPSADFRLLGAVDFAGNGKSDLAMLNINQGDRGDARFLRGFSIGNDNLLRQVRTLWRVDAAGDLDGDGFGDLVWRFTGNSGNIDDTGVSYVWFSNGTEVSQVRKRGGAPLNWTLLGAADLNGDGAADMVYVSPANTVRLLMATANRTCANIAGPTIPDGFVALKLADFTGNRRADLLIRHSGTGEVRILSLSAVGLSLPAYTGAPDDPNASCTSGGSLATTTTPYNVATAPANGAFFASGDFNGDGYFDVAWKMPDNTLTVWLMNSKGNAPTVIANAGTLPAGYVSLVLQ